MKKVFSFLLVLTGLLFFTSNNVQAQSPASEITISGTTTSSFFEGIQVVADCSTNAPIGKFKFWQPAGSGVAHYYDNVVGHYTYYAIYYDQFGNSVTVGDPSSGHPSFAFFPTGDYVKLHFYGCGHPTVVEIGH